MNESSSYNSRREATLLRNGACLSFFLLHRRLSRTKKRIRCCTHLPQILGEALSTFPPWFFDVQQILHPKQDLNLPPQLAKGLEVRIKVLAETSPIMLPWDTRDNVALIALM